MGKTRENKHVCHLFRKKEQMANLCILMENNYMLILC
jgi:hypothetical protein